MARRKKSSPEELVTSRDTRIAIRRLDQHERYLALLRHAQRIRLNINAPDTLAGIISSGEAELQSLRARTTGRISPRRRPQRTSHDPVNKCTIFVDECGASSLTSQDEFGAFIIAAVIVSDTYYPKLDVRRGTGPFYFNKDTTRRAAVIQSLHKLITKLDFTAVACVVNRPEYVTQVGTDRLDESLPINPYLMVLDFLMERLVMILERQFNGAQAHVVAEARGPLEDALLQYEYVRLQLDGTSYISESWFRQQLAPAIEFKTKKENSTGLQLADLLARPCGEKVLDPPTTPVRWPEFREKLCTGQETAHSILGLKVIPWHERYVDIWKN